MSETPAQYGNQPPQLVTRVEILEGATATIIHKQDQAASEARSQFGQVNERLAHIEQTLHLLVQMINERLPPKASE